MPKRIIIMSSKKAIMTKNGAPENKHRTGKQRGHYQDKDSAAEESFLVRSQR